MPKPSIRELKEEAKLLGMDYSWSIEWQEHRVNLKIADGGTEDSASYTDDAVDALMTMRHMARERDINRTIEHVHDLFIQAGTYITEEDACEQMALAIRRLASGDIDTDRERRHMHCGPKGCNTCS